MKVLYDGWPLVREPTGPAGLHLLAILDHLPEAVQPVVALPAPAPPWLSDRPVYVRPTPDSPAGRLIWEQHLLPWIARHLQAPILHLTVPRAPVLGVTCVVSPSDYQGSSQSPAEGEPGGIFNRLRTSFGLGGLARAARILWPEDFPPPGSLSPVHQLAPIVSRDFHPQAGRNGNAARRQMLEGFSGSSPLETFILYHGPTSTRDLHQLVEAWTWVAIPVGDYHPLLVVAPSDDVQSKIMALAEAAQLGNSLRALAGVPFHILPWLYQECTAVFHPVPSFSPWGSSIHHALACGKAIVAAEDTRSDAQVGPAAYLIPPTDLRGLAAALITVIVEEEVRGNLESAARQRAAGWQSARFSAQLLSHYREISG